MVKKDLTAAAAKGADLFFTTSDAQDAAIPHKAQEESAEQLEATIQDMHEAIITQEQERAARREAQKAATAEKHASKRRITIEVSRALYDYVAVMAGISGTNGTRYVIDLIERDKELNGDIYSKAKELVNARKR